MKSALFSRMITFCVLVSAPCLLFALEHPTSKRAAKKFYKQRACRLVDPSLRLRIDWQSSENYTIELRYKKKNTIKDHLPMSEDGLYYAMIEIPAGCDDKWEWKHEKFVWDQKKGHHRLISYLPYVVNYGMVLQTLGGDGDPLDVVVLGPAIPRGKIIPIELVGVLEMMDNGESDHKIIAVPMGLSRQHFSQAAIVSNGIADILKTWFLHYKNNQQMTIGDIGSVKNAQTIIQNAMKNKVRADQQVESIKSSLIIE